MSRVRSLTLMLFLVLGSAGLFGAGGYYGTEYVIDRQNRSQLRQLSELVMSRAERQADFAFIALGDLVRVAGAGCNDEFLVRMRQQVYLRSTVKDIRIVDDAGHTLCAAFPETLEYDAGVADLSKAAAARNSQISLFKLDQRSNAALGVLWRVPSGPSLVAIANIDALLFDVLPSELHDGSQLHLALPSGEIVAAYTPAAAGLTANEAGVFNAHSARYPLAVRLAVDGATLKKWNKGPANYSLAGGAGLGIAFGFLLGRVIIPRRTFLTEIDEAIASSAFKPFAQPVFCLSTGSITGCEILARWVRADGTVISPDRFISIAEKTGRIALLTRGLMRDALRGLEPILTDGREFTVAFNISPEDFLSAKFAEEMRILLAEADVPPERVVLEITERQDLSDPEGAAALIRKLAAHGIRVAIDDAGTGHNGLSHIQKLKAQILKIDKFFVDAVELDFSARVIIEMLVKAADQLGMTTIAEGIERIEQLQWLRQIGVNEGQGFILSPPVPLPDFLQLVKTAANVFDADSTSDRFKRIA